MPKSYLLGIGAVVLLLLVGGVAGSLGSSAAPQPSVIDVRECNEYARWMAERESPEESPELRRGVLRNTGTVEGLAEDNQENARAMEAYRQCMVRRGYRVWG